MSGAPSDERSSLSFVLAIVRPLSANIYRFPCNAHISNIKLLGFGPRADYADRATAACWRSSANFADRGCRVVSATDSHGR
jgi:hypothetical protein